MTKQFLLQVQFAPETLLPDEKKFLQQLRRAADYFATLNTRGPVPLVKVLALPDADRVNMELIALDLLKDDH